MTHSGFVHWQFSTHSQPFCVPIPPMPNLPVPPMLHFTLHSMLACEHTLSALLLGPVAPPWAPVCDPVVTAAVVAALLLVVEVGSSAVSDGQNCKPGGTCGVQ